MEHILDSSPGLAEAYERGIDVQLGVCVWGIFPGAGGFSGTVPHLVGLADGARSWFVSCDRLIVASGARDLAIGFPGWEKPGVMGAQAALQLMQRYDAFTGTRILLLGSGPTGARGRRGSGRQGARRGGMPSRPRRRRRRATTIAPHQERSARALRKAHGSRRHAAPSR